VHTPEGFSGELLGLALGQAAAKLRQGGPADLADDLPQGVGSQRRRAMLHQICRRRFARGQSGPGDRPRQFLAARRIGGSRPDPLDQPPGEVPHERASQDPAPFALVAPALERCGEHLECPSMFLPGQGHRGRLPFDRHIGNQELPESLHPGLTVAENELAGDESGIGRHILAEAPQADLQRGDQPVLQGKPPRPPADPPDVPIAQSIDNQPAGKVRAEPAERGQRVGADRGIALRIAECDRRGRPC